MILDKYLTFQQKIYISLISCAIWIYFRTAECYLMIPRKSLFSVIFVVIWVYINYYEPLVAPIGLTTLYLYSKLQKEKEED
jgi:hypothetical protein